VTIHALDQFGNIATGEFRSVTLVASVGAAGSTGQAGFNAGVATHFVATLVAETVTLSLIDSDGTGVDVSSTQSLVFTAGPATSYTILDPTDATVGDPVTVTVQAQDDFGNLATGENRDVTLNTSGSATGGGLVAITAGTGSRNVTDAVPETVILTLTDTQGTGLDVSSQADVVFSAGAATQFVILNPTDGTVDSDVLVTIQAQDQFGNVVLNENRDVTLVTSGTATGGGLVDIIGGQGFALVHNTTPATITLSLSDTQGTGLNVSSTQNVVFSVGAAAQFVILNPADGTVDNPVTVTVQAQDQWGNLVTTENRDVTLVTSGSATGGGLVNIVNGVGTISISDAVPETVFLSLSDTQGTGLFVTSVQDVVFSVGSATQFVILDPADATVGNQVNVTVQALDQFNNIVTTETRDVTLNASGSATGDGLVDIVGGTGTIAITDNVPETVTLTLSDTQGTGLNVSSTQDVVFSLGGATQFVILNPADGTVDNPVTVTVQAQDQFGNLVTTENRDVTLITSGSAVGGLVNIINGVGTLGVTDNTPETVQLSLLDTQSTGLTVTSVQDVVFGPGVATQFVIVDPADGTVGTPVPVTVQALDQFGNLATGESRDVTLLASGSATVANAGLVDIAAGTGTVNVDNTVAETVTLTLSDTQGTGLTLGPSQDVIFAAALALQIDLVGVVAEEAPLQD
jgi:hypothetical protein